MGALLIRERMRTALGASVTLHALLAFLIPALALVPGSGDTIETLTFVRALPIHIETPRPVAPKPVAVAEHRAPTPHIDALKPAAEGKRFQKQPARRVVATENAAPIVASHEERGVAQAHPSTSATPVPSAAPTNETVASVQTRNETSGFSPLGADQPVPVLDPNVRKALAQMNVHVTLTIVVSADGKTQSVTFEPPLDSSTEDRIRSMLASASWDPANCGGGIGCQGKATIKL